MNYVHLYPLGEPGSIARAGQPDIPIPVLRVYITCHPSSFYPLVCESHTDKPNTTTGAFNTDFHVAHNLPAFKDMIDVEMDVTGVIPQLDPSSDQEGAFVLVAITASVTIHLLDCNKTLEATFTPTAPDVCVSLPLPIIFQ